LTHLPFGAWKVWQLLAALSLIMAVAVGVVLAAPSPEPVTYSSMMRVA
jgi:hypothetical protein